MARAGRRDPCCICGGSGDRIRCDLAKIGTDLSGLACLRCYNRLANLARYHRNRSGIITEAGVVRKFPVLRVLCPRFTPTPRAYSRAAVVLFDAAWNRISGRDLGP